MKKKTSTIHELKDFLDDQVDLYNRKDFIQDDPISIPHRYSLKEDIEISGFLTATIAWGRRPMILKNAERLMLLMDDSPYDFISNANRKELKTVDDFVHRTFNGEDCCYFLSALKKVYQKHGGLEGIFSIPCQLTGGDMGFSINEARKTFLSFNPPTRVNKHFADPLRNSSAKRINMFLRWMVRKDRRGVDFGIWKSIKPSMLFCPLDVHSGRVARQLGLLLRKQDDWKATTELTTNLRILDPVDPVKYDFALFGMGVEKGSLVNSQWEKGQ